jgi:hypothetical protein
MEGKINTALDPHNRTAIRYVAFSELSQNLRKNPSLLKTYDFDILAENFRKKVISKLKTTASVGLLTFVFTEFLISKALPTVVKNYNKFKLSSLAIAIVTASAVEHVQRMKIVSEMGQEIDRYLLDPRYTEYMKKQNIRQELIRYLK